jgi:hypothetical protein
VVMRSEIYESGSAANEDVRIGWMRNRTLFPAGTTVRIFRRSRSAMSSGAADTRCWRLTFHGRGRRFIEPVMGWTGSADPLAGWSSSSRPWSLPRATHGGRGWTSRWMEHLRRLPCRLGHCTKAVLRQLKHAA